MKQRLFLWMQGTRDLALLSVGFPAASCPASRFPCDRVNKVEPWKAGRVLPRLPCILSGKWPPQVTSAVFSDTPRLRGLQWTPVSPSVTEASAALAGGSGG